MLISICSSFCINETNTSDNLQPLKYQKHHSTGKYFENLSALFLFFTVAESIYFCMQTLNLSSLSQRYLFSDSLFSSFLPFASTAVAAGATVQDVTCGTTLPVIAVRFLALRNASLIGFQSLDDTFFHSSTSFTHSFLWF